MLCFAHLNAQFNFSVNPGIQSNSAAFGYQFSKVVPYLGVQLLNAKGDIDENGKQNDINTNLVVDYNDTYEGSFNLFMPTIGAKYFFLEKSKLKAYANINVNKAFMTGKAKSNTDPIFGDDVETIIKNTKISGGQLGFGTEYFFDNNFSIGGEFGIRMIKIKTKDEVITTLFDPVLNQNIVVRNITEFNLNLNPTYAKISLNFYFGD